MAAAAAVAWSQAGIRMGLCATAVAAIVHPEIDIARALHATAFLTVHTQLSMT
jgi:hypothetical protein